MITAHSGCEGTGIDTMDSIEKALEVGADAIEIDVRMDPFGELRISHDPLSIDDYLRKNPLEDVFRKVKPTSMLINFDIKESAALAKTLRDAYAYGFPTERLIMTGSTGPDDLMDDRGLIGKASFFLNIAHVLRYVYTHRKEDFTAEMYMLLMEQPLMLVIDEDTEIPEIYLSDAARIRQKLYAISKTLKEKICEDTVRAYQESGSKAVNFPKILLGTKFISAMKSAGIPLSVWTVDDPDLIRRCLNMEVLNITTRAPRKAVSIRDSAVHLLQ